MAWTYEETPLNTKHTNGAGNMQTPLSTHSTNGIGNGLPPLVRPPVVARIHIIAIGVHLTSGVGT